MMLKRESSNGVLITLCDCTDPEKEQEYGRWYREIHIPGMEELGFVGNPRRFENALSGSFTFHARPKYMTLWDVYTDDLTHALQEIRRHEAELEKKSLGFGAMAKMVDALYGKVGAEVCTDRTGRPLKGLYLVLCGVTDPAREQEFNRWYDERHAPDVLNLGFQDTCRRYKIVEEEEVIPFRYYYATLYDISMDPLESRERLIGYRSKWLEDPLWVECLSVYWTGAFKQVYPALDGE